jgi:hypothetical protein
VTKLAAPVAAQQPLDRRTSPPMPAVGGGIARRPFVIFIFDDCNIERRST